MMRLFLQEPVANPSQSPLLAQELLAETIQPPPETTPTD